MQTYTQQQEKAKAEQIEKEAQAKDQQARQAFLNMTAIAMGLLTTMDGTPLRMIPITSNIVWMKFTLRKANKQIKAIPI